MNAEPRVSRAVLADALDSQVAELFQVATELGSSLRQERDNVASERMPDIRIQLEAALRASLEDEIIPISPLHDGGIDESEVDREVIKKALVSLKLGTLRKIARADGTAVSGSQEDVATRIAQHYQWAPDAVARLILANEDEPSIHRGHISRIFPMTDETGLRGVRERLASVIGRYIRIGVARWFLFEGCNYSGGRMEIKGKYKTYQAAVEERNEKTSLAATPHEAAVRIRLNEGAALEIIGAGTVPSKAAVRAFGIITGFQAKGYLPIADKRAKGIAGQLHATSEFLLDLVSNRLAKSELKDINLTVARFNMRAIDNDAVERSIGERRPELKAVRFEGNHLLDSAVACRLLSVENRPLVEIAFQAYIESEEGLKVHFPVRVTTESDHLSVQTGLGETEHELSLRVHSLVVEACFAGLAEGVSDPERMVRIFDRMKSRAESNTVPEVADIFADLSETGDEV